MSLQSTVEQVLKMYKEEQVKIDDSIVRLRKIVNDLTRGTSTESEKEGVLPGGDILQEEKEDFPKEQGDIELLEQALQKAMRVRTGAQSFNKECGIKKEKNILSGNINPTAPLGERKKAITPPDKLPSGEKKRFTTQEPTVRPKMTLIYSTSKKGEPKLITNRNVFQNHPHSSVQSVHRQTSRKLQQAVLASATPDQIATLPSENKTGRSNMESGDVLSKAASVFKISSKSKILSKSEKPPQNRHPPEQVRKRGSCFRKRQRLWEKFANLQQQPKPGRTQFMEKMRATFPKDWPSGSPEQAKAQVEKLTQELYQLEHEYQAEKFIHDHASEMASELGWELTDSQSAATLEKLEKEVAELRILLDQAEQEWKAWDQWRPEGACLDPPAPSGEWSNGITSPLPMTLTYETEEELQEVERVRASVALLQEEIQLEDMLMDALLPQLSSLAAGSGSLEPSVLRDMYSLLVEGGERFPAIVIDPEQTDN